MSPPINHFDLFGLRQAYLFAKLRDYTPIAFQERWLYAWVRHPMMLGLLIAFWSTPKMSVGHLVFASAATGFIFLGTILEERDMRRFLALITNTRHGFPRLSQRSAEMTRLDRGCDGCNKRNETGYAHGRDLTIAYQVVGEGPIDLVVVPGMPSHVLTVGFAVSVKEDLR